MGVKVGSQSGFCAASDAYDLRRMVSGVVVVRSRLSATKPLHSSGIRVHFTGSKMIESRQYRHT